MSLETYTGNISDLVATNPTGTDPRSQGDDHLRGIKFTLKQSFPLATGPVRVSGDKLFAGDSATQANNFVIDASADNGTMKLARESGQDIMTVDAAGKVALPQTPIINTGPAVYTTFTGTTVNPATPTPLTDNTPVFDTASRMDATTGKFTPDVAGYYQCNAEVSQGGTASGGLECRLVKNGGVFGQFAFGSADTTSFKLAACSGLVYMNGTTDFIEVHGYCASVAFTATGRFSAFLARSG